MVHCWRTIKLEEGTRALYSGLAPALLRQAVYGTIKYGLYYTIKDLTASGGEESPLKNVSIAVIAGSVSAAIATPTDVLKVRLQSRSAPVVSPKKTIRVSLYNCFNDIYRREGVAGLWRGAVPTASRAALVAGVQLPVYDMCKHFMLSNDFLPGNVLFLSASYSCSRFYIFVFSCCCSCCSAFFSNSRNFTLSRYFTRFRVILHFSRNFTLFLDFQDS